MEARQIGAYQLLELLGRGGMAVVYKALQPALQRHVAIKVLHPQFVNAEGFRARFQKEAETVARLEHPNILPIYDYGQAEDGPYIVMPLITGGTLREWLGRSVPLDQALRVFSRVLAGVEYAHTRQPPIIHRDIKPTNILMRDGDWPLLADFGLARILEPSTQHSGASGIAGTPEYMSPEQCTDHAVDHRSDLYAMGIVLYKVLTGRVPFQGASPTEVMLQQVREAVPSVRLFNPHLSPAWDDVVQRSLAKNPDERYSTAVEMAQGIQGVWRQREAQGGEAHTVAITSPKQLYDLAERALVEGNWPRVVSLCSEILTIDPMHPGTLQLLAAAHEGLHRQSANLQGQKAIQTPLRPAPPPPAPRSDVPLPAKLTVLRGLEPGRTYTLDGRSITLGRHDDNQIQIKDAALSRRHCQVTWTDGAYVIEDLGSSNGTHVNGSRVQVVRLSSGDRIRLGGQMLEFNLDLLDTEHGPAATPANVRSVDQ